jgi:hypothetical protein
VILLNPTWRHVERRTTTIVGCNTVGGSEAEICKFDCHAFVGDENVLRLQISVVNSNGMAILHGFQDLKENGFSQEIITNISSLFSDVGEQITFGAVLKNNVYAVRRVHDLDQRKNIGMEAGLIMELNLSLLESLLAWFQT